MPHILDPYPFLTVNIYIAITLTYVCINPILEVGQFSSWLVCSGMGIGKGLATYKQLFNALSKVVCSILSKHIIF